MTGERSMNMRERERERVGEWKMTGERSMNILSAIEQFTYSLCHTYFNGMGLIFIFICSICSINKTRRSK